MTLSQGSQLIGRHPQPVRYYLTLALGTFRTGLDVAMLVVGSGLVGLAVAVILDGFDVVDLGLDTGIGATLGAGLVIGVCGAFALGVASEGRYGSSRRLDGFPSLEVAIGRLLAIVLMALVLLWAAGRLEALTTELPYAFNVSAAVVRSVGMAGFVAAVLGVGSAWSVRRGLDRLGWGAALEIPALYVVWLVAAIIGFELP
jgi:hypothetical protein